MIKQLPAFPAPPRYYSEDVAQDIVAQFAFRNNSLQNEAAPLESMVLSGATISGGQLQTTALANTYQFHCPYFGAGDFTVECKITFTQWGSSVGHYILCQHAAGDKVTARNSWMFRASNTGTNKFFQWIENRMGVTSYNTAESAPFFVQLNKEYHAVVERFAGVTRIFVDGFLYGQFASAEPLVESPDNVFSESWDLTGFGRCLRKIRDIRIAKRAMYKGKVPRPSIREVKYTPVFEMKFDAQGAYDFISGNRITLAGSTTITDEDFGANIKAIKFAGNTASYATFPNTPALLPGTGDFTIEWLSKCESPYVSGWTTYCFPILFWGTWMHQTQPMNLDIVLSYSELRASILVSPDAVTNTKPLPFVEGAEPVGNNKPEHWAMVRKSGILYLYRNGKLQSSTPFAFDMKHVTNQPIYFGKRFGGSSGNVYWGYKGSLTNFRMYRGAKYESEFEPYR